MKVCDEMNNFGNVGETFFLLAFLFSVIFFKPASDLSSPQTIVFDLTLALQISGLISGCRARGQIGLLVCHFLLLPDLKAADVRLFIRHVIRSN